MENPNPQSFKRLTISAEQLPDSMARREQITSYAALRAKLLLGCYRTGDANDPETYVAAITAVLARYPQEVITTVTHPATGLPSKKGWLPTIKEVTDACDETLAPIVRQELRLKCIKEQLEARERENRGEKLTLEQLKDKYGPNWGLTPVKAEKTSDAKAEENRQTLEREQARVRAEYEHMGMSPPSKFALSMTARKVIEEQNEVRAAIKEAREKAE